MRRCWTGILCLAACVAPLISARADAVGDFYNGKTVTLIMSVGEGDGMDKAARIIARHWSKHIPGNPNIVVKNMPGAGSLRATNFLYSQAPKDGTTLGGIIPAFVRQQLLGGTGVDYDAAKFNWLGSSNISNPTVFVWRTTGVTTLAQARTKELLLGATGAGSNSAHYPTILNNVLGTKFKIIMGYRASPAINLAIEQGEVHGRAGQTFNTLVLNHSRWLKEKKVNILVQIGTRKERGFEQVPLLTDFARDPAQRDVLRVFSDEIALGRPYLAPPDVPAERVAALRKAFAATMQDPDFLVDAKKLRLDVTPTGGDALQKLAAGLTRTHSDVLTRVKAALVLDKSRAGKAKGGK
ncbi:MAG: Bug family tripartite tricarboxylate transporter substrate binding protein [Xanthobacteraceae bacterium]